MTAEEWIREFAARLGIAEPSADETTALLELASVAAHASERRAAPIACYLAARAGVDPATALAEASNVPGAGL